MRLPFVFYEKGNCPSVLPVMRVLVDREWLEPFFVRGFDFKEHTGAIEPLELPPDVPQIDLLSPDRAPEVVDLAGMGPWRLPHAGPFVQDLVRALGHRPHHDVLPEKARRFAAALRRFVRTQRPPVVVLPEDTDYIRGRLAAAVCRRAGVRVVVFAPNFYNLFVSYPLVGERMADAYLVMNDSLAERLRGRGVDDERIHRVGSPAFDGLGAVPSPLPAEPVFLYVLQGLPGESELLEALRSCLESRPEARLLVRPHPECRLPVDAGPADGSEMEWSDPSTPIEEVLAGCSCVIARTSTVLYQALVLGRDVIVPHLGPGPLPIYLPPEVVSRSVAPTVDGLRTRVAAHAPEAVPRTDPTAISATHPNATRAVADTLERLCEGWTGSRVGGESSRLSQSGRGSS